MKKFYYVQLIFILLFFSFSRTGLCAEPPYLAPIPNQTALVGQLFTLDINAVNANPAETYELTVSRPGMTIDPVTGVISWTPADIADGGLVTVRAYNTAGESIRSFTIYLSNAILCPPTLASYWKLDSITGDTVYSDYTGGFDAKTKNALVDTIGVVEGAQLFKPTTRLDQFLQVNDSSQHTWARSGSFSFSFWFLYKGNNLANNQVLIGKGRPTTGYSMILVSLDTTGAGDDATLKFELKNKNGAPGDIALLESPTAIQKDNWYFVTAEYEGAVSGPVTMRLYVNGVKAEKSVSTFDPSGFTTNGKLSIGYWNAYLASNTYPFNGAMDDIALFNKALSDTEVVDMYTAAQAGMPICRPGNYAPLITSSPVTTATQDVSYTYTVTTEDYENSSLTLTAEVLPLWLNFDSGTGVLSGTPSNADVGDNPVDIMVTDGNLEIHQSFTISVANVNDSPTITSVPQDTVIQQGDTFSYTLTAIDIDKGDVVTLSAPVLPTWLTFDPGTGVLEGIATNDQVQFSADSVFTVQLKATDSSDASAVQEFTIRVINVNDPPVVVSQSTLQTDRNVPIDVSIADLTISDPDTHPSDLEMLLFAGDHYTVSGNTITPALNYYGDLSVNTKVTDKTDTVDYTLAITVNFVNIPPEFTSVPVTSATEGSPYTYLVSAGDIDISDPNQNQTLTFWVETLPSWLTFNTSNLVLVGVPENADVGNSDVKIGVTDGIDTTYQEFTITVANVNNPPVITGQNTVNGVKNSYVVITTDDLVISDPDNVPADMTVIVLNGTNYTVNGDTVFFAQDFLGTVIVSVKVNDGQDDSNVFQLSINVQPGVGVPSLTGQFVNRIYPNPASQYVVFDLKPNTARFLEIRDLTGRVVIHKKLESGMNEYRINVSDFARGLYIYRIYSDTQYQTGKLLIE